MLGKLLLVFNGFGFLAYGLLCAFLPDLPAGWIGYELTTGDARVELIAMYGGLEAALGVFFLLCLWSRESLRTGLHLLVVTMAGLGLTRLGAYLMADVEVGAYTYFAIAFELGTLVLAIVALRPATAP